MCKTQRVQAQSQKQSMVCTCSQKRVSVGWWLLQLTFKILAILWLTVDIFPLLSPNFFLTVNFFFNNYLLEFVKFNAWQLNFLAVLRLAANPVANLLKVFNKYLIMKSCVREMFKIIHKLFYLHRIHPGYRYQILRHIPGRGTPWYLTPKSAWNVESLQASQP